MTEALPDATCGNEKLKMHEIFSASLLIVVWWSRRKIKIILKALLHAPLAWDLSYCCTYKTEQCGSLGRLLDDDKGELNFYLNPKVMKVPTASSTASLITKLIFNLMSGCTLIGLSSGCSQTFSINSFKQWRWRC